MTTHTTPIDLRPYHGRECEAVMDNRSIKGKISVNKNGAVFVCCNDKTKATWNSVDEMFGYPHSWCVQRSFEQIWRGIDMESITLLDEPKSINPEWDWKDGEIVEYEGTKYMCIRWNDIIVSFVNIDENSSGSLYTFEEAYLDGYRKLPPPPSRKLVEITEEMFDKTNLIGRKVEYEGRDGQVIGMFIHPDGSRSFTLGGVVRGFNISQCKLIEE